MRKLIATILIPILLISGCSRSIEVADNEIDYRKPRYLEYNPQVYWTFDREDQTLYIDGQGPLYGGSASTGLEFRYNTVRNTARKIFLTGEITYISAYAFSGFESLTSVVIDAPVIEMGMGMFSFSNSLTEIDIGSTQISRIAPETFWGCETLGKVILPATVQVVEGAAFKDCTSLKQVTFLGTEQAWDQVRIQSFGNEALLNAQIIIREDSAHETQESKKS